MASAVIPPDPLYIDTPAALAAWVQVLDGAAIIAVDTESDSFHRYREKVCLIQMTAQGQDVIIDPLALPDLSPLAPMFADPNRVKIFHDACYDLICLHRDYGFRIRGLFDTMLASRLIGRRQFGLAALLQQHFGFTADKRLQRSDWARRPLSPEQLTYARYDTHYLLELRRLLMAELRDVDRLSWAEEDFGRLPENCERLSQPRETTPDAQGFWRITGARLLSPEARGRLQALWLLRERLAQRLDRPPFKVLGDAVLLELAQEAPQSTGALQPRPGLRRGGIDRFGPELQAALAGAQPVRGTPPTGLKRRRSGRFLDPLARERYEALRGVRRTAAEGLGLEPEVILGNAVLEELARRPPLSAEALVSRPELLGWRRPHLQALLFAALQALPGPAEAAPPGVVLAGADED